MRSDDGLGLTTSHRFHGHLLSAGFVKETEVTFPHKQAWMARYRRENWEGPSL